MTIITIDFEASCLPRHGRSFPIEVGIAGDGMARSWLIRPHDRWFGWDWTVEAEALHGLSRARIEAEGLPVETVLAELGVATAGRRVIADSLIDQYWLDTLAEAAGTVSPCRIEHVATLFDEQGADEARIAAAVDHADNSGAMRHRAAGDALWLAALVDHLTGRVQPRPVLLAAQ
ncbi:hypothetical protein DM806_03995 [Sphingobium lactosutens]|uniref:hypothetical protein n=1 Tax=Sphingobium lactosutens TaxID=522773 RepID=UPI0015BF7449|nr:hypothetical protein [Sphingobium lactosutens]NWK94840.1 hypothetical protein [Sphingobium lactosutens]